MTLSATQMAILTAAAQQPERLVLPPAKLPPAPREAIRRSLISQGLIEPMDLPDAAAGAAWAADGTRLSYRVTAAGLAAIRTVARREADLPPEAPTDSTGGAQGAAGGRPGRNAARAAGGPSRVNLGRACCAVAARPAGRRRGGARRLGRHPGPRGLGRGRRRFAHRARR